MMTSLLQLFDHSSFSQPGRDQRSAVSISCRSASHAAGIWPAAGSGTRWWPQCFPVHVRISCQHGDCISSGFFSFFALRPTATHSTCRWPCETLRPYQAALLPTHTQACRCPSAGVFAPPAAQQTFSPYLTLPACQMPYTGPQLHRRLRRHKQRAGREDVRRAGPWNPCACLRIVLHGGCGEGEVVCSGAACRGGLFSCGMGHHALVCLC